MKPIWEQIEEEMPDIKIEHVDVDQNNGKLKEYNIENIPAFVVLDDNNQEINRGRGIHSREEIIKYLNKFKK